VKPAAIEEEEIITLQPNIDTKQSNTSDTEIQATMTDLMILLSGCVSFVILRFQGQNWR
jgi:hypothetical protein